MLPRNNKAPYGACWATEIKRRETLQRVDVTWSSSAAATTTDIILSKDRRTVAQLRVCTRRFLKVRALFTFPGGNMLV